MDRLAEEIKRSIAEAPDDYDAREPLWMERENLRAAINNIEGGRFR